MTTPADDALARLDDYLRRFQGDDAVADYEEDLFARAFEHAAPELQCRAGIRDALRELSARGTIDVWLTAAEVARMQAGELRVLTVELDLANPDVSSMAGDYDVIITKVPLDLTGIRRLDAEVLSPTGERLKLMPDIRFEPNDNAVFACCEAELARTAAAFKTVTRLWAVRDEGRQVLCEIKVGEPL